MTITRQYLSAKQFQRWMEKAGLSTTDAAAALGCTSRAVRRYIDGTRPVSKTVALAMAAISTGTAAWHG